MIEFYNEVQRHPDDNVVWVRTEAVTYSDTQDNFEADFGVTLPSYPDGANEQIYTQGRRHAYMGGGDVIAGGPMPWDLGDQIITNIQMGLAAQAARTPTPEE